MKVYCINKNCPFKSCKKHIKRCRAKTRKIWVANSDGVCKKYIRWLIDSIIV